MSLANWRPLGASSLFDVRPLYTPSHTAASRVGTMLSMPGFESEISRCLAARFNVNSTIYDRTIDSVYNEFRTGGSQLHHNLDGNHTWSGAMDALREAYPHDPTFQHVMHASNHLARDFTTPSGINPFLDPHDFTVTKDFLESSFGLPHHYAADMLNVNAAELLAAVSASAAIVLDADSLQGETLGRYIGRLAVSGAVAANPFMLVLTAGLIAQAASQLWRGDSATSQLDGISQSALSASAFFAASAACTGPLFVGIVVGTTAAMAAGWAYGKLTEPYRLDFESAMRPLVPSWQLMTQTW